MTMLPPENLPPESEPVPDGLLKIVLLSVGITLGLSVIAIWIVTHTG